MHVAPRTRRSSIRRRASATSARRRAPGRPPRRPGRRSTRSSGSSAATTVRADGARRCGTSRLAMRAAGAGWDDIVRRTIYTTQPTEYETITTRDRGGAGRRRAPRADDRRRHRSRGRRAADRDRVHGGVLMSRAYDASSSAAGSTASRAPRCSRAAGWRVCVLERNDWFGGAIKTEEITRAWLQARRLQRVASALGRRRRRMRSSAKIWPGTGSST